jgi:hypothetical protein
MYLHALNLSFIIYYHYVYERGRSSENMNSLAFNHKKFSSYFCTILLLLLQTYKSPKNLFPLFPLNLLNLRVVSA